MPSSEFDALALLIVLVLAVALVNTWLLTTRRTPQSKPSALDDIPMPAEPFPPSAQTGNPFTLDRQLIGTEERSDNTRRAAPTTQRLAESEWYGGGGIGTAPWGRDNDGDDFWPQAR